MSLTTYDVSKRSAPSRSCRPGSKADRVWAAAQLRRKSRKFRPSLLPDLEPRTLLSAISDNAYPLLGVGATADQSQFYVYQNSDSGLNHSFPSRFFADSQGSLTKIHIDTAAIDDPSSPSGTSTDPNALDPVRGTVFKATFDPLTTGQYVGVNFEEPENWGVRRTAPGASFQGYDLQGATTLVLDVRSPTPGGIWVQFGVGGSDSQPYAKVTDYLYIPQSSTYQPLQIPLSTLRDPFTGAVSSPDLSSVHILFSVATNNVYAPQGGTLLIDNVRFDPVPTSQASSLSFPLSTATFGVLPQSQSPFPLDQVLSNVTTTYETSLTIIDLLDGGTAEDLADARALCDALVYALNHDNAGDPLPTVMVNGAAGIGLHNAYSSGDLALLNNQDPSQGQLGQQGQVRLAGFSVPGQAGGTPAFYLVLDGATGGNNAFAMMALVRAYQTFGDSVYLNAARTIGLWIAGNLTDTSGTGYGGYFDGYPDEGAPKQLITGKSTENNADIAAAFMMLAQTEQQLGNTAESDQWTQWAYVAGDFVMAMFDPASGRFNAGTVPAGTAPGPGIDPSGPQKGNDVINTFDFLDAQTFTTLALAGLPRYQDQIDWHEPIEHAIDTFAKTITATTDGQTRTYQGFSLVATPTITTGDPDPADGIAWEFTGQVVVAMRLVDELYGQTTFETMADSDLAQIRQAQQFAPFGDGEGVVAATLNGENDQGPSRGGFAPVYQDLSTPFQGIPERVGLAATTWAIFADSAIDPLGQPSSAPGTPVLTASTDTGSSSSDDLTNRNNSSSQTVLQFQVGGIDLGATVSILADGVLIGAAVATGPSIVVTTDGTYALTDGSHLITARQTAPGQSPSAISPALTIVIDTTPPRVTAVGQGLSPFEAGPVGSVDLSLSEPIDPSSLSVSSLSLTRDGQTVPLTATVSVTPLSATTYQIQGLAPFTTTTGNYVLEVRADGLRDLAGNLGVGSSTATWFVSLTVQSVQPAFNRGGFVTSLVLSFNGPLDRSRAQSVANYALTLSGPDRKFGTRDDRRVSLRSARCREQFLSDALGVRSTVTLTPAAPFRLSQLLQIRVNGQPRRGLRDTSGRLLDGDRNGLPGGNFVTVLGGTGGLVSASSATVVPMDTAVVDAVLPSGASVPGGGARRRH
ncbi:MAG: hypothetical protein ACHRXM_00755 [Isosphaerales bacterium]